MRRDETIHYLEMSDPGDLRPARPARVVYDLRRAEVPCPEVNRFFYTAVGGDWLWIDRLDWSYADWLAWVLRPGHETWIATVAGTPAAYFELDGAPGADTELVFFGVLPQFAGLGLGGALLTDAVRRAWARAPPRVWLHTCSFDHPGALRNYLARGFRLVRSETHPKDMPDAPPGPWPGAGRTPAMIARLRTVAGERPGIGSSRGAGFQGLEDRERGARS